MPYLPGHKPTTRARIVESASRLFRRDGYAATGVDALMAEAGLTRGGFYAHFRAKATLLGEAVGHAFDESHANLLARGLEAERGTSWARAAARRYLGPKHLAQPDAGCPIPALATEVARGPAAARRAFARRFEGLIDGIAVRLGAAGRKRAIVLLASWAGAILIARALGDAKLAAEVLEAVRSESERA